ncbi:MAG TPA: hypothetical protein VFL80_01935 [Thermoanaerobaculia bacterium]|nr:hypothetical protein [Thermoanaerobaculia bacterium]
MPFPEHLERILDDYGVAPDTKAALFDLYVSMGDEVLSVFGDLAENVISVSDLTPDDTLSIRSAVVERYLRRNHPRWLNGEPTASLWHPRVLQGRASGVALPLISLTEEIIATTRSIVGEDQPLPEGVVLLGKNAHYGGRQETISFDVIPFDVETAIAVGRAAGQQHTLPGSIGETSATYDAIRSIALIWEVQPNVYKPAGERNRDVVKTFRRHRNWHVMTLVAALLWLRERKASIFILRGNALATTHEVNPAKPVSPAIADLHDRTVTRIANGLGARLVEISIEEETLLLESIVLNHALRKHGATTGITDMIWRLSWPE